MIAPDELGLFLTAALLLGLAPGPDNLFVLSQSMLRGRRAGLAITLGLCTGLMVHTGAVALGVAALFMASAAAFTALKLVGAGYLLYLAWRAFGAAGTGLAGGDGEPLSGAQLYRRGILMNLTNPKVSIFFLAFLPQFADPARGALSLQLLVLGGLFIGVTLGVFGGVALAAGALGERLQGSARVQRWLNRAAGTLFAALALRLLAAQR